MRAASELRDTIERIFREQVQIEVPSAETDLFDSGALDSLALVRLLAGLEEELGTKIPLADLEISHFRSVATIAGFLSGNGFHP